MEVAIYLTEIQTDFKNSLLLLVSNVAIINHYYLHIMLIHLLFNLCGTSTSLHQDSL